MKLSIFQSAEGDCFLLAGADGKLVLCDGGMSSSMKEYVRDELAKKKELEYIYVSHVDNDHITGIYQLLQDEAVWRVYEHQKSKGKKVTKPTVPRPPKIKGILHNGFSHQVSEAKKSVDSLANAFVAGDMLASRAPVLFALNDPEATHIAQEMERLALGVKESIGVSSLIAPEALAIPLNKVPGVAQAGKLLRVGGKGDKFTVGGMTFTLLGPTTEELKKLQQGWITYLKSATGKKGVDDLRAKIKKQVDDFSTGALSTSPFDLTWHGVADYKGVSVPNIASMMFMVEEGGKRLLLTGDGQQDFIIKGLEKRGFLKKGQGLHIDVLKVQHHGSDHNIDEGFVRRVSADHYVFGASGEYNNPDIPTLDMIYASRLGDDATKHTLDPQAKNRPFTLWFSTTSKAQKGKSGEAHFKAVEKWVAAHVKKNKKMMKVKYNTGAFIDLPI